MKLNWTRTFFVGLAFFLISLFWQSYDGVIQLILENTFGLNPVLRGFVMALDNILALFLLPLFGRLSDKTRTRWGKRTPYIVVGTLVAAVGYVLVAVFADSANLPGFFVTLMIVLLAMSVFRSPAVSLMPDVTPKPLRSKANAVINLMGALGGLIVLVMTMFIYQDGHALPLFAAVSGIMVVALIVFLFTVREPSLVEKMEAESRELGLEAEEDEAPEEGERLRGGKLKSMIFLLAAVFLWFMAYNAVTSSFSLYAQNVWNITDGDFSLPLMVAQGAAIVMFIPVGFLASRIGRKKTILIGILCMIGAFGAAFFFKTYSLVVLVFFALAGVGWATINVNSYPMVVEMSRGSTVGAYTGLYYTASMAGQIATPILSGVFIHFFGYGALFPYSVIFMVLALVSMIFVRHGDSKAALPKSKLELYDQ